MMVSDLVIIALLGLVLVAINISSFLIIKLFNDKNNQQREIISRVIELKKALKYAEEARSGVSRMYKIMQINPL